MKILLVDDEVSIIQMLLPALKSMSGAEVRAAISGEEAIASAEAWGGIDLLITDVFMDPMNGFTLRNKLEQRHPPFRALFLSGHELSRYAEHIRDAEVLYKPFDWNQMLHAIAAMNIQPSTGVGPAPLGTPAIEDAPGGDAIPGVQTFERLPGQGGDAGKLLRQDARNGVPTGGVPTGGVPTGGQDAGNVIPPTNVVATSVVPAGALDGTVLGSYRILRTIGFSAWGTLYHAVQMPMGRAVIMEVLQDEKAAVPSVKQQFLANAAARANVHHPFFLAVYEGGDVQGHCFYTYEGIEGECLASLVASGYRVEDRVVLSILEGVAGALAYLESQQIAHADLDAASIFLGPDSKPRMANPALQKGGATHVAGQIRALAGMVKPLLPGGRASSKSLRTTMVCMEGDGDLTLTTWAALLQLLQVLHPAGSSPLALPGPKGGARKPFWFWSLLALVVGLIWGTLSYRGFGPGEKGFERMLKVPVGEFIYQEGKNVQLPEFWIDTYEVTVGQYAKFLEHLQAHPEEASKFDAPAQPKGKLHIPHQWGVFYAAAKEGQLYKQHPIDLNTPVFNVDWWDACAYARWKGRRLPTEQEWEKAARLGIVGMAGNVSEWTSTLDPEKQCPVIRGGNFTTEDNKVARRIAVLAPDGVSEQVGFRTVSDKSPNP